MEAFGVIALGVSSALAAFFGARAWNRAADRERKREEVRKDMNK